MPKDTRTRILETTARLLQHRGYHGTSLNDILSESGTPRGSLYFHFPGGKDQLVLEATRATVEETTRALGDALALGPTLGVRRYTEMAARLMRETDFAFGCPVAPVILDGTAALTDLAAICREAFETWDGMLQDAFVAAGMAPERATAIALMVSAAIEGALVMARAARDEGPLMVVACELERMVAAELPPA
ncbi:TetR/AcrR family transcriptional regulator [Geminicoccus roseus]|uniref:TetR/AcrR family transcriptional regulator n=1 Tax=Geminicoccus roseus TaxID=404900 RepID=UPI000416AB9C|nr:TetR/AcrR family transcriptional regulator [Geminicoccus roseus]